MGSKCSNVATQEDPVQRAVNKQIQARMEEQDMEQRTTLNMLLLGAGGSGKTTVSKQMEKVFAGYIEQQEMELSLYLIQENIINDMVTLCQLNMELNAKKLTEEDTVKYTIQKPEMNKLCTKIATMNDMNIELTSDLANEIHALWTGVNAIRNTWDLRKKSHTMDNTPYFFNKATEIANDHYVVTFDDFVRLRDATTGITDKKYLVQSKNGKYKFNVTDVGGQRSERRKWMKLFDKMDVVIYIVNLAGYDQVLYEDNSRNRLTETLELFSLSCHSKAFADTDWVVFFNKIDVFQEKIKSIPFTMFYDKFNDDGKNDAFHAEFNDDDKNDAEKVKEWIQNEFHSRFKVDTELRETMRGKALKRSIYFHTICAIDEDDIAECIKTVQIDIIVSMMKKMGYC